MRIGHDLGPTKASNRLSHGLSSRAREEEWFEESKKLAIELIGDVPVTSEILSVAIELAQTIFRIQAIADERRRILSTPAPPPHYDKFLADKDFKYFRQDVIDSGFCEDPPRTSWAQSLLRVIRYQDVVAAYEPNPDDYPRRFRTRKRDLLRMDEYERKARSRRSKLSNRLDYLILETRRQNLEEETRARRGQKR